MRALSLELAAEHGLYAYDACLLTCALQHRAHYLPSVVYFLFRQRTGAIALHLVSPVVGFIIIGFVLMNADVKAKIGGLVWLAIGVAIVIGLRISGRSTEFKLEE